MKIIKINMYSLHTCIYLEINFVRTENLVKIWLGNNYNLKYHYTLFVKIMFVIFLNVSNCATNIDPLT